jgi:hypothetical protein
MVRCGEKAMNIKDKIMELADSYAADVAEVHPALPRSRAALVEALDAADREVEELKAELKSAERSVINRTAAMQSMQNASDAWCEVEKNL